MLNPAVHRSVLRPLFVPILLNAAIASAQQGPAVQAKAFDVVSIRQNVTQGPRTGDLVPGPDGFRITRTSLFTVMLTAYPPESGGMFLNRIENMPDWLRNENYDIDARVSDADRAAWQDPKNQPAMLQTMLQSMFADRFKLVVHREMKEVPVFDLVVAKSGQKFAETKPDEPHPAGATLPGGGVMGAGADGATHMYNFSMGLLCALLTGKAERPVLDKTGLSGRYTIDIREPQQMAAPSAASNGESEDERRPAVADSLKSVGLELKPAKEQVEFLVIDHVEKPTEN